MNVIFLSHFSSLCPDFCTAFKAFKSAPKNSKFRKICSFCKSIWLGILQKQFSNKYLQNFQMFENHPMKKLFVLIIFNRLDDNPMPGNTVFSNISVYSLNYGVIT